jgi:hypothetical protein
MAKRNKRTAAEDEAITCCSTLGDAANQAALQKPSED